MLQHKKIAVGFGLVTCLMITLGGVSLSQMRNIALDVDQIYSHPFAVSNATNSIDFNIASMRLHMNDACYAKNSEEFNAAVAEIDRHEIDALKNFQIVFERFLGDKKLVEHAYQLFIDWKVIRSNLMRMAAAGEKLEIEELSKEQSSQHVAALSIEIEKLKKFAFNKADEMQARAQEKKKTAISHIFLLTLSMVFMAIFIAGYVIRNNMKLHKERNQRLYLIDQNIMLASLDIKGVVLDVSNALCRFLGNSKEELIGKPSNFFDNSDEASYTVQHILKTIQTGKSWKGEIKHFSSDGQIYWASSSIIPNLDDEFKLTGYTNILEDTTNKKLSVTDKLTTLFNRRRYEEIIVRELRLAQRNESHLTLAMIDIDFFKKYNDNYGHPKGDTVLSSVAECLLKHLKRPNDFAFRMGGEEFALIFSGLNLDQTKLLLDDVRASVEALEIEHKTSSVCDHLTISIGAHVILPNMMIDMDRLYVLADKALYIAKEKRNTVVVTS
jgi:diguanylate cyclase (GGDEF)-like protein/PAS domain S-box-containing protein